MSGKIDLRNFVKNFPIEEVREDPNRPIELPPDAYLVDVAQLERKSKTTRTESTSNADELSQIWRVNNNLHSNPILEADAAFIDCIAPNCHATPTDERTFHDLYLQVRIAESDDARAEEYYAKAEQPPSGNQVRGWHEHHTLRGMQAKQIATKNRADYYQWPGVDRLRIELEADGERLDVAGLAKWRARFCKNNALSIASVDAMRLVQIAQRLDGGKIAESLPTDDTEEPHWLVVEVSAAVIAGNLEPLERSRWSRWLDDTTQPFPETTNASLQNAVKAYWHSLKTDPKANALSPIHKAVSRDTSNITKTLSDIHIAVSCHVKYGMPMPDGRMKDLWNRCRFRLREHADPQMNDKDLFETYWMPYAWDYFGITENDFLSLSLDDAEKFLPPKLGNKVASNATASVQSTAKEKKTGNREIEETLELPKNPRGAGRKPKQLTPTEKKIFNAIATENFPMHCDVDKALGLPLGTTANAVEAKRKRDERAAKRTK